MPLTLALMSLLLVESVLQVRKSFVVPQSHVTCLQVVAKHQAVFDNVSSFEHQRAVTV
jgi:hypothetical protein